MLKFAKCKFGANPFFRPVYQTSHTDLRCADLAAEAELITIQRVLDRCKKRRYISYSIDIHDLLENKIKIYALKLWA